MYVLAGYLYRCIELIRVFNENNFLVLWKPVLMEVNKLRLIEEVRKRPKLWVTKYVKGGHSLWSEIGQILDADGCCVYEIVKSDY